MAEVDLGERAGWLRIGQLAAATGESTKTLRFYDDAGVLTATARSPAGYRLYAPAMVDRVALVRAAQAVGLRLEEIAVVLDDSAEGGAGSEVDAAAVLARIEVTQQGLGRLHRWIADRARSR